MNPNEVKRVEDLMIMAQEKGLGKDPAMETKANEVVQTGNNAEWYDAYGMANAIKDLTAKKGQLLPFLGEGNEGSNLPVSYPIPYDITDYFMRLKAEWDDMATPTHTTQTMTSSKATLSQVNFIAELDISDEMIAHSTDKNLYDYLVGKMAKIYTRTVEGLLINGDSEAGATGNVNSDDQAPATTFAAAGGASYYATQIDHGFRELAINNSKTVNVGAFDSDDLLSIVGTLGEAYQEELDNLLFLANPTTYVKMMGDDALKLANQTSRATIDGGTMKPFGIDLVPHSLVPKTEADGKVSATPENNTLGQILCVYKPSVRWGFGKDFKLEVERVAGYGYRLIGTMQFSFVILDSSNTVAAGINVTIA